MGAAAQRARGKDNQTTRQRVSVCGREREREREPEVDAMSSLR
jgi:hypothetical protein